MLFTKTINTAIDIQDCIGLYTDLENNLTRILADRYEGICYASCMIIRVEKIIRTSNLIINQDGEPTFGTMNVTFTALALRYDQGEVINGCEIVKTEVQGVMIAKTQSAAIMFSVSPLFASLIAGQKMSVRVDGVRYVIGTRKLAVSAVPFIPHYTPTIYRINGVVDQSARLFAAPAFARVEEEQKTPDGDARQFFKNLLYPYSTIKPAPETVKEIDLFTDSPPAEGYLSRDPGIPLDSSKVWYYPTPDLLPEGALVQETENIKNVLFNLANEYAEQLRVWREHSEIYADETVFKNHKNLMLLYRKAKITL